MKDFRAWLLGDGLFFGSAVLAAIGTTMALGFFFIDESTGYFDAGVPVKASLACICFLILTGGIYLGCTRTPSFALETDLVPNANDNLHSRMLRLEGDAYVLEIRGAGFGTQPHAAQYIWRSIQETKRRDRSFLLDDPAAFPDNANTMRWNNGAIWKSVMRSAVSKAVEYWPIPGFVIRGPRPASTGSRAAARIADGINGAGLGVTMALWQYDEIGENSQKMIEKMFVFFDQNHDVPEALIAASDGDAQRNLGRHSTGKVGMPVILNSHSALILARSDRVDQFVRPHMLAKLGDVRPGDIDSDPTRFWHFFWHKATSRDSNAFDAYYRASEERKGHNEVSSPGIMATDWWLTQLPEFWEEVRLDKTYKPSLFLPVRWTGGQLRRFDSGPLFGYLHRPMRVPLHDEGGQPLSREAAISAVREGWRKAIAGLPGDGRPARLFYDTTGRPEWEAVLADALCDEAHPLDVMDVQVGYDMSKRLGDTGAVSALGQIALATVASHGDGLVSATINLGVEGDADILIVTPADAEQREKNLHGPGSFDLFGEAK